jgi:hypothetical protein
VIKSIQKNNVVVTGSGKYKDDKLTEGTLTYSDGLKYSGSFKNDLYEGKGKITYQNGDIAEGIFKEGKLTPNSVTYYLKAGDKFIGDFDMNNFINCYVFHFFL